MLRVIDKPTGAWRVRPNLVDYEAECRDFRWDRAREALGLPNRTLNIAYEAVTRHALQGRGNQTAIRHLGRDGTTTELTYSVLDGASNRFANVLETLGVAPGDAVFSLSGRVPGFYAAALGSLKRGAVFCPLFSAFGPEPIRARLEIGRAIVLVTTRVLYQRKVAALLEKLPRLRFVLLVDGEEDEGERVRALPNLLGAASPQYRVAATTPDDAALMHFTSGTTGRPKGAILAHDAVVAQAATARYALDLHDDDVFWCTADPGWVTGMSYGVIGPLVCGVTSIVDEMEFDADRWYSIIQREKVTVWYSAPTAIRMLMKVGADVARKYDLSSLRFLASVGEPLNPEAVVWSHQTFGRPFHDNWWQTETGGIMIANLAALPVKPGSMGKPLPGIEAAVVQRQPDGSVRPIDKPNVEGELALKAGWPSMFRAYLGEDERYRKCFVGPWYLTGDLARRDQDGYYWFVGRADDVIKTAGHLIGPFEIESALMEHPAVAEAAAIGKPDEVAGNTIKAFVALKAGLEPGPELERDLMAHARRRLGPAVAPREIAFRDNLPKTRSGKIMRRLLRARELGLAEGDISTLESDEK